MSKSQSAKEFKEPANPIDFIEEIIGLEEWPYQRLGPDDIAFEIPGRWGEYRLQFVWQDDLSVLQLYCLLDLRAEPKAEKQLFELLTLINQKLALGHFEVCPEEASPMFRYATIATHLKYFSVDLIEELVDIAVSECERFYPAFQFVLWGGKTAKEAVSVAMLDTQGEA